MSYYDHAVLMHLKQGPWAPDPHNKHRHQYIAHQKRVRSSGVKRGIISVLVVAVGILVLGATGFAA